MVDAVHSGYKEAAQSVVFSGTQQIDSLLDNEWTDLSDEIDNSSLKYLFADLELVLGSVTFVGTDSAIEIYLVPSIDDTNYPDWTGNVTTDEQENNKHFVGSMTTTGAVGAQRMTLRAVNMPPGKFKFGIRSRAGVTLAASGNTLKYRRWNYASQ
jgi:hypothetical protein